VEGEEGTAAPFAGIHAEEAGEESEGKEDNGEDCEYHDGAGLCGCEVGL